jgi:U6 snRNA-associated Sm-like protein LSm8
MTECHKELQLLVNKHVSVITNDGRNIVGTLKGLDQKLNIILEECHERVFSAEAGVEQVTLGLYIVRGDNIAIVGELDEEMDGSTDWTQIRADPLKHIVH